MVYLCLINEYGNLYLPLSCPLKLLFETDIPKFSMQPLAPNSCSIAKRAKSVFANNSFKSLRKINTYSSGLITTSA